MKILTVNFLTCAVKACKSSPLSFPLHFQDAELEQQDMEYNPTFLRNILPRIEWDALKTTAAELGFTTLPPAKPEFPLEPSSSSSTSAAEPIATEDASIAEGDSASREVPMTDGVESRTEEPAASGDNDKLWRDLHTLLLETQVMEGKMVCGNCGHEYKIKDGILRNSFNGGQIRQAVEEHTRRREVFLAGPRSAALREVEYVQAAEMLALEVGST